MPKDARPAICGVWVRDGEFYTYHRVGSFGVSKIEFSLACGLTGYFDTVMVYREDKLMAEYPFHGCVGVDYFQGQPDHDSERF